MHLNRWIAAAALAALVLAPAAEARRKAKAPTEPGSYTDWAGEIDHLEVVKSFQLGDYSRVEVDTFATDGVALPDASDNSYAPVKAVLADVEGPLTQGLAEELSNMQVVRGGSGDSNGAGTLLLRGRVLEMDPGSRAARYWAGFGAGAARTKLEGEVVDAATGTVLLRFTQERRSGVGVGGGKYDKLMQRNLSTIGEDVALILNHFAGGGAG